jgi:hypothetical protein
MNVQVVNGRLIWKCGRGGHMGSDPSNPDKLCNPVAEARLVSYWQTFVTFSLLLVLSHLQFASPCRKSIRNKWWKNMAKASTMRRSSLKVGPSMTAEAEKHTDGEINALFSLTLWMWDMVSLTIVDCLFLKLCYVRWGAGLQGGNTIEVKFVVHFYWSYASCISDALKLWVDARWA